MFARRAFTIALFSIGLIASGCSDFEKSVETPVETDIPAQQAAPQPTQAVTPPPDAPAPDMLAAKVKSYTDDLEPKIHHDRARADAVAPAATQPVPQVNALVLPPPVVQIKPAVAPQPVQTIAAAPAPQPAPTPAKASGDANFPITLPESADNPVSASDAIPAAATSSGNVNMSAFPSSELDHKLAQHVRDYPSDVEGQLDYQLLLYIEGQQVPEMSTISGLSAEDRELVSAMMDGLSNFRSVVRAGNNSLLSGKVAPLLDMADRLRTQAELSISSVALCSEVKSYGVYTAMNPQHFVAGRDNQMIVYCEVQNFQSQLTADSQWQTRLSEELTLYTETGMQVWPDKVESQPVTDLCHEKRHDFFIARLLTLPANLSIGRYILKLTVVDEQANRVAEASIPVEIGAE